MAKTIEVRAIAEGYGRIWRVCKAAVQAAYKPLKFGIKEPKRRKNKSL